MMIWSKHIYTDHGGKANLTIVSYNKKKFNTLGKNAYSLYCQDLDEKIDSTRVAVC